MPGMQVEKFHHKDAESTKGVIGDWYAAAGGVRLKAQQKIPGHFPRIGQSPFTSIFVLFVSLW